MDLKEAVIESVISSKWPSWAAVNIIAEWVPILNRKDDHQVIFKQNFRKIANSKMLQRYGEYVAIAEIVLDNRKLWATIQAWQEGQVYESLRALFDPLNLTDTFRLHLAKSKI